MGKMKTRLPRVGDVMQMLGFADKAVYAHYISAERRIGSMIQVYIGINAVDQPCDVLALSKPFPPVLCGVNPPVREGQWVIIGSCLKYLFEFPEFLSGGRPELDGTRNWFLVKGTQHVRLGNEVPAELQHLECNFICPYEDIEERIRTGVDPFSYEAIMKWKPQPRARSLDGGHDD